MTDGLAHRDAPSLMEYGPGFFGRINSHNTIEESRSSRHRAHLGVLYARHVVLSRRRTLPALPDEPGYAALSELCERVLSQRPSFLTWSFS